MARCWACQIYRPYSMCQGCAVTTLFDTVDNPLDILNQCMDNLGGRSAATLTLFRTTLMELDEPNREAYLNDLLQNPPRRGLLRCLSGAMTWFIRTSLQIVRVLFNQAVDEMPSNGTSSQASSIIEYPSSSHGSVQVSRGPLNQAAGVMASNGASSQASNSVSINETPSTSHGSDPDYVPSHTHTPSSSDGSDLTPSSAEGSGSI